MGHENFYRGLSEEIDAAIEEINDEEMAPIYAEERLNYAPGIDTEEYNSKA